MKIDLAFNSIFPWTFLKYPCVRVCMYVCVYVCVCMCLSASNQLILIEAIFFNRRKTATAFKWRFPWTVPWGQPEARRDCAVCLYPLFHSGEGSWSPSPASGKPCLPEMGHWGPISHSSTTRPKPEAQNPYWVSYMGGQGSSYWAITCWFLGHTWAES